MEYEYSPQQQCRYQSTASLRIPMAARAKRHTAAAKWDWWHVFVPVDPKPVASPTAAAKVRMTTPPSLTRSTVHKGETFIGETFILPPAPAAASPSWSPSNKCHGQPTAQGNCGCGWHQWWCKHENCRRERGTNSIRTVTTNPQQPLQDKSRVGVAEQGDGQAAWR